MKSESIDSGQNRKRFKYIVTGSEGFIGKNLVQKLQSDGHQVHCVDIKQGYDLFDLHPAIFKVSDGIFHLACVNQEVAEQHPMENIWVNVHGARFLAEMAKKYEIPLFYTSTASVYGQAELIPTPVAQIVAPLSAYAVAKLAGEHFVRLSGCQYKIFRLSNVYGPFQTTDNPYCGVIGKFIDSGIEKKNLKVIQPGTQTRDFSYVDDVVKVLTENTVPFGNIYNLSRGEEISIKDLARKLAEIFGVYYELIDPRSIDKINRRCLESDFVCSTSLEDGLRQTIEWSYAIRKEQSFSRLSGSGESSRGLHSPSDGLPAPEAVSTTPESLQGPRGGPWSGDI